MTSSLTLSRPLPPPPPPPGVYVPVPTFFHPPSAPSTSTASSPLDLPTQCAYALHLAKSGIRGLVLLGSTGEAVHLTNAERTEIIRAVRRATVEAGFPSYPLIAGTATQSVADTLVQLTEAKEAGAQWGLVLAPGYFASSVSQEAMREWYTAVADQSPMPIMIYHYPAVSNNVSLPPSTIVQLSKHKNIVGCKLSHGNVSHHTLIASSPSLDKNFTTFTGLGQQLTSALLVGCHGAIDGLAGFFPKTVVRLYDLSTSPEAHTPSTASEIRRLQYLVSAAEELVVTHGTVGIKEAISRVLGMGPREGGTRAPLAGSIPGGEAEWDRWRGVMGDVWEVEQGL